MCILTGLGEKSAEALIRFGGLAFFGQISIRLGGEQVSRCPRYILRCAYIVDMYRQAS